MKSNIKPLIKKLKERSTVFYSEHTARVFSEKFNIPYETVLEILKKRHDRFMSQNNHCENRINQQIQDNFLYGQFAGRFPSVCKKG